MKLIKVEMFKKIFSLLPFSNSFSSSGGTMDSDSDASSSGGGDGANGGDVVIKVNKNTTNPSLAWVEAKIKIKKIEVNPLPLNTPIYDNKVRFVCLSDTHNQTDKMTHQIPNGDVLIHAGDFTNVGAIKEIEHFNNFLASVSDKFKHKVVIAGNHELTFEPDSKTEGLRRRFNLMDKSNVKDVRELLTNCTYLEDSAITLFGIKIYGSPYQPWFGSWAFNKQRGEDILQVWNKIPNEVDVLITHGPPLGFGDTVRGGMKSGCCELLSTIQKRVKPKYHIFGHIHEDYGIWTDTKTTYINASTCNYNYKPINPPIIFDVDLPEGYTKQTN